MCGLLSKLPRLQKWRKTKLRTFLSSLLFGAQRVCTKWNTSPLFATKTEVLSRNVHPFSNARLCIFHRATVAIVLFGGGSDLSCICGLPFVAAGRRATSRSAAASSSAAAAPTATVTRGNCTPSCNGKNTVQLNNHLLRKWCSGYVHKNGKTPITSDSQTTSRKYELTKLTASASGAQFSSVCGLPKTRSCK